MRATYCTLLDTAMPSALARPGREAPLRRATEVSSKPGEAAGSASASWRATRVASSKSASCAVTGSRGGLNDGTTAHWQAVTHR